MRAHSGQALLVAVALLPFFKERVAEAKTFAIIGNVVDIQLDEIIAPIVTSSGKCRRLS
jgi:hypothetical protein